MKKILLSIYILLALLVCLWTAKCVAELAAERTLARQETPVQTQTVPEPTAVPETAAAEPTVPEMVAVETTLPPTTEAPETQPAGVTIQNATEPTFRKGPTLTEEEEQLLLKLGMAERGETYCTECIALVMRTVLNRVESPKFSSTVKGVIYAQDQFTPVMDGSFEKAEPNPACEDALALVKSGWDESQGALYYEWCEGESWHSQNLNLLLQHCDTRFYN